MAHSCLGRLHADDYGAVCNPSSIIGKPSTGWCGSGEDAQIKAPYDTTCLGFCFSSCLSSEALDLEKMTSLVLSFILGPTCFLLGAGSAGSEGLGTGLQ